MTLEDKNQNDIINSELVNSYNIEYVMDKFLTSEDLYPLAITTIRRLEKLEKESSSIYLLKRH